MTMKRLRSTSRPASVFDWPLRSEKPTFFNVPATHCPIPLGVFLVISYRYSVFSPPTSARTSTRPMNGHGYQGREVTDYGVGGWRSAKRLKQFEA
ncbi:hypothetical protein [Pseudomonas fluorescens group sp. PF-69]